MSSLLPLPTLLSQSLVAYTVELDDEAELRFPHRTTRHGATARRHAPWLGSFALWANALQYVGDDGITVTELRQQARTSRLLLGGLRRWRYVDVEPPAGEDLRKPPQDGAVVRVTPGGRRSQPVWSELPYVMDVRWRDRFGPVTVDRVERALRAVFELLPIDPPDYLPFVFPTQGGRTEQPAALAPTPMPPRDEREHRSASLSALLSGVLLMFTLDFENEANLSLAIGANTLRVLDEAGVRPRDLPRLTGVSKEGNAMCSGWLERRGYAVTADEPGASRGKLLPLTDKGQQVQHEYERALRHTEAS